MYLMFKACAIYLSKLPPGYLLNGVESGAFYVIAMSIHIAVTTAMSGLVHGSILPGIGCSSPYSFQVFVQLVFAVVVILEFAVASFGLFDVLEKRSVTTNG